MSSGIEEDDTIQREKKKNREEEEKKNKQEADETKAQPKERPKRNSGMVFMFENNRVYLFRVLSHVLCREFLHLAKSLKYMYQTLYIFQCSVY